MKRALRCDKMTIAALSAVLRLYRDPDSLVDRLPTLRALTRSADEIKDMTARVMPAMADALEGLQTLFRPPAKAKWSGVYRREKLQAPDLRLSRKTTAAPR